MEVWGIAVLTEYYYEDFPSDPIKANYYGGKKK